MPREPQDLTGQKFGDWTVLARAGKRRGNTTWLCRCKCGSEVEVMAYTLFNGASRRCRACNGRATVGATNRRNARASVVEVVDLLRDGLYPEVIAARLGVHWSRIYQIAKEQGVPLPERPKAYIRRRIREMLERDDGRDAQDMANELGVTLQTVRRHLRRLEEEE